MPAKDQIHESVKQALIKDGWRITNDPYTLEYEDATLFIDLGAERVIAAERDNEKIAVEIKTFSGYSVIHDFEIALGQYHLYFGLLEQNEPERILYLAISRSSYENIFERKSINLIIKRFSVPLLVVNVETEEVVAWIN